MISCEIIINNRHTFIIDHSNNNSSKSIDLKERISEIEIYINGTDDTPRLFIDPQNGKDRYEIPLEKHLKENKYILNKLLLEQSDKYKYIFNIENQFNLQPEGLVKFDFCIGKLVSSLFVKFPFLLLTEEQFNYILNDLQNHKTNIQFSPNSNTRFNFRSARFESVENISGSRRYILIKELYRGLLSYIKSNLYYTMSLDDTLDSNIIINDANIIENKFIKFLVVEFINICSTLKKELRNDIKILQQHLDDKKLFNVQSPDYLSKKESEIEKHRAFENEILHYSNELYYFLHNSILRHSDFDRNILFYIGPTICQNSNLVNLFYNYFNLYKLLEYDSQSEYSASCLALPEIYEHWTFIKVCECIENLGYKLIKKSHDLLGFSRKIRPDTSFSYEYIDSNNRITINIIYDKYYERIDEKKGIFIGTLGSSSQRRDPVLSQRLANNESIKRNPDISLEIYNSFSTIPMLLFFDATYTQDSTYAREVIFTAKMAYTDWIRYKDSSLIGIGSWALHPQIGIDDSSNSNDYFTIENDPNGTLVFNPNSKSFQILTEVLVNIFSKNGIPFSSSFKY